MKQFQKIISVKCPTCEDHPRMSFWRDKDTGGMWRCDCCVYSYQSNWFNTFKHYEKFVMREGDKKEE